MTPAYAAQHILPAAFALLPERMDSPEARAMLLAIALQESKLTHRRQIGGPARGYWQFETAGVTGVLDHPKSGTYVRDMSRLLDYTPTLSVIFPSLADNDILACCFARLLLWTLPDALPTRDEPDVAWRQYLAAWRPGKPHPETWAGCWEMAWRTV